MALRSAIVVSILSCLLVACGGGGNSGGQPSPSPAPRDVTPDTFSIPLTGDVLPSTSVTSDAVAISGFEGTLNVTVSSGYELAVNGGDFQAGDSAQAIESGQTVQIRGAASSDFDTTTDVTLTLANDTNGETVASQLWQIETVARDVTPEDLSFASVSDVALSTVTDSAVFVISTINDTASISIDSGSFSIDGGSTFVSEATTVDVGASIVVRVTSSDDFNETVTANLTVGTETQAFSVTTFQPDAIVFESGINVAANSDIVSDAYTLTGITGSADVSIANGSYRIGESGDFVTEAGTLNAGETVYVTVRSAGTPSTDAQATLTVGNITGSFIVTTIADMQPPEVVVAFPPENSMTEANTVRVRGSASDWSAIRSVSIVNGDATTPVVTDDDYATWYADVVLAEGDNTLTVVASDEQSNTDDDAGEVRVKYDPASGAFPDSNVQVPPARAMAYDGDGNRLLISGIQYQSIVAVSLETGARSIISDASTPNSEAVTIGHPYRIFIPQNNTERLAYVVEILSSDNSLIYTVDLDNGERDIFSDATRPNTENPLFETVAIIESPLDEEQLLVGSSGDILSVARNSGSRTSSGFPVGDTNMDVISGLAYNLEQADLLYLQNFNRADASASGIYVWNFEDARLVPLSTNLTHSESVQFENAFGGVVYVEQVNRAFTSNSNVDGSLVSIDLVDGSRELFVEENETNELMRIETLAKIDNAEYIFVVSYQRDSVDIFQTENAIHAVDVTNGNRVYVSKWHHTL